MSACKCILLVSSVASSPTTGLALQLVERHHVFSVRKKLAKAGGLHLRTTLREQVFVHAFCKTTRRFAHVPQRSSNFWGGYSSLSRKIFSLTVNCNRSRIRNFHKGRIRESLDCYSFVNLQRRVVWRPYFC